MNNPLSAFLARQPSHSFVFAYQSLPEKLWGDEPILGKLADPHERDILIDIWSEAPAKVRLERERSHVGLERGAHWIGGEHLAISIALPTPVHEHDPMFVVVATSPEIRYFVFEFGKNEEDRTCSHFCEWLPGNERSLFGDRPLVDESLALRLVCQELRCPESVEDPLGVQLGGVEAKRVLANCDPISPRDATLANDLEMRAHAAAKNRDSLERAQELYRKLIDFRLSIHSLDTKEIPSNYARLVSALLRQGKISEAEAEAREAWAFCRRHRELGHPDSLAAIGQLAECLRCGDRDEESFQLQNYRAQLASMTRGKFEARNVDSGPLVVERAQATPSRA